MNTVKNLLLFVFAGAMLASCSKTSYKKTAGGMPYKVFSSKDTQKVRVGDFIKISLEIKLRDSVLNTTGKLPAYFPITSEVHPYDYSELWTSLKVGDSVVVTQMIDTFMKRNPQGIPPQFKKGDKIMTYIKVLGVFKSESLVKIDEEKGKSMLAVAEVAEIEKYLADKKIKAVKTPSGAFVEITNPGVGAPADSGKYVSVNYTGTSWSGKKFDSNTDPSFNHVGPYSFTLRVDPMIKGFNEALEVLGKGGKGKAYIPSLLAYGGQPNSPLIKPYESLIFDLEMVDIKDKAPVVPPAPQQPGQQQQPQPQPQQ
jgi:FKBP-type peptidyl-prolyl cis-trans isomerase FkpA